jgi:quercetin dioxygenase-like cupin family protein
MSTGRYRSTFKTSIDNVALQKHLQTLGLRGPNLALHRHSGLRPLPYSVELKRQASEGVIAVIERKSPADILERVTYLPDRTPEMAFNGGTKRAFLQVAPYRNGAIFVGHYSGNTEWERHPGGDEIVMSIEGSTTVVLLVNGEEHRIDLSSGELVVVPQGSWHRFEGSTDLKVLSVTPQPTEHSLELPDA